MKKLFFTAIAVLALSGKGFAETKEVKVQFRSCKSQAIDLIDKFEEGGGCLTSNQYNLLHAMALIYCGKN